MGGSSSQPQPSQPPMSPINAFSLEELYTPDFSENTAYWQEPNPCEATGEEVVTSPTKKKKATRNHQKSEYGNARKKDGFWVEVMEYIESKTKMEGCRMYDMESGAGDEDYVQKAMIHYQAETGLPFKFCHCWDVLKDSLKFADITFPKLSQGSQGSNKRHKSPGSSSFNTDSGEASINLNNTVVGDDKVVADDDEVVADDDEVLVVNEMTAAEVEQREKFIELKRREVECREREIAATEYRTQQEDMKLYLQPYDHLTGEQRLAWEEIRAKIKMKYNLQF
ncbi:hypothetical protein Tco_1568933 [Tanacetum coccineum]